MVKKENSFFFLNATQFLDAINENLFKLILAFYLIAYAGPGKTSAIMASLGAIFIIPFILFSSVGGIFADRWSKTSVIRITRVIQIIIISFGWVCMVYHAVFMIYVILFLYATLAAIFGPSKYGMIPELVSKNQLRANSIIAAFTFFAIIFGYSLGSILDVMEHGFFALMTSVCIAIAILGTLLSYFIAYIPAANPKKKWSFFVYSEIYTSLVQMHTIRYFLAATFAFSYFLFIGAFVQMNIIPYSVEVLKMGPAAGGYLFISSGVGIGFGSLLASKMSGRLTILPMAGLGMSICCVLFEFYQPFWLTIIWLFALGVFGGLFLVPSQAFILSKSPLQDRGRNFATANFFSFVFAFLASAAIYILNESSKLRPSESFVALGIFNLLVSSILFYLTREKK
jgi:acyl-[acyl-carrier-protein]-phospholipid O-acyltransferase / long-chain-fatty-acid--[acyl-carrier-protein] ligase